MFSKYEEISKLIKSYIEESLTKITGDASIITSKIEEDYNFTLSITDITNLGNAISIAKQARSDYESGLKNSQLIATTDWSNALEKAKELVATKEGAARDYAFKLASKVCIGTYKGPLTIDTMKELKEHGYDGTYGSTTMMQMYAIYVQNQNLIEKEKQDEATIAKQAEQLAQYDQSYRTQFIQSENLQNQNKTMQAENENLRNANQALLDRLNAQTNEITALSERVDSLSKKWSTQLVETFKSFFGKDVNIPEEVSKPVISEYPSMQEEAINNGEKVM